jgi:hypothetical protein
MTGGSVAKIYIVQCFSSYSIEEISNNPDSQLAVYITTLLPCKTGDWRKM